MSTRAASVDRLRREGQRHQRHPGPGQPGRRQLRYLSQESVADPNRPLLRLLEPTGQHVEAERESGPGTDVYGDVLDTVSRH